MFFLLFSVPYKFFPNCNSLSMPLPFPISLTCSQCTLPASECNSLLLPLSLTFLSLFSASPPPPLLFIRVFLPCFLFKYMCSKYYLLFQFSFLLFALMSIISSQYPTCISLSLSLPPFPPSLCLSSFFSPFSFSSHFFFSLCLFLCKGAGGGGMLNIS